MNQRHVRRCVWLASVVLSSAAVSVQAQAQQRAAPQQDQTAGMTERERAALDKFTQHESRFKDHYESHYAQSGYGYNQYRPAYRHGFDLALDQRYRHMDWSTLELQARRTWDDSQMGMWDRYKDAVRFGWEQGVILERG